MRETAYTRLFHVLQERILNRSYSPGERLPTERSLCEEFGVSRITCRHAVRLLQERGLVERFPGRGTFVRSIRPNKVPLLINDYSESIRKEAPNTGRKLLTWQEIVPPEEIASILGLFKSEVCMFAERIDLLDSEPLAFDHAYLPKTWSVGLTEDVLTRVDFLDLWLEQQNLPLSHVWNSIEAVKATPEMQRKLELSAGCPMLKVTDIIYSSNNRPLAVFVTFYRGDRFKLISTNIKGGVHGTADRSYAH
jgi:GntR family transcriptional regulator